MKTRLQNHRNVVQVLHADSPGRRKRSEVAGRSAHIPRAPRTSLRSSWRLLRIKPRRWRWWRLLFLSWDPKELNTNPKFDYTTAHASQICSWLLPLVLWSWAEQAPPTGERPLPLLKATHLEHDCACAETQLGSTLGRKINFLKANLYFLYIILIDLKLKTTFFII